MTRILPTLAIVSAALVSAAIGFVAGVVLMAAGEAELPEPAEPPRWERSA